MKNKRKSNLHWRGFLHGGKAAQTVGNGRYSGHRKLSARAWRRYNSGCAEGFEYEEDIMRLWHRKVFRGEKIEIIRPEKIIPESIRKKLDESRALGRYLILKANGKLYGSTASICWVDDCKE